MVFNKPYQHPQESVVSYAFSDTATGLSYIPFYAIASENSGAADLRLITTTAKSTEYVNTYPNDYGIVTANNQGNSTQYPGIKLLLGAQSFDTKFNVPLTIEGSAIINFSHGLYGNNCPDGRVKTVIGIRKNAVELVSGSSQIDSLGVINTTVSKAVALTFDVPKTSFKIGDTLSITAEGWAGGSGANWVTYGIGTDPADRNDPGTVRKQIEDVDSTQLIAYLPVRADL